MLGLKPLRLHSLDSWQRSLVVLWIAQATSALGFSFVFPFIPLFVQELGVEEPGRAALWSGIAGGVGGFFMMLSGPFWGILGDRYGRKKNVLRALFGSAVVLALTSLVTDVYQLVALRILLGLVSGVWVTVMALGASMAPRDKVTFSIGVVQSASFLGSTMGPFVGGMLADTIGFRATFVVTGLLSVFSALLVILFIDEHFQKPQQQEKLGPHLFFASFAGLVRSRGLASSLLVIFLVQVGPTMMMPVLPVFIKELSENGSASSAGIAFSLMGLMGVASSLFMTRLGQRVGMVPVLIVAFVCGGILYLPLLVLGNLLHIYLVLSLLGFFNGGLNTMSFALVGNATSREKQGAAYGVAQSSSALAWGSGPLMGGTIADLWGLRQVFLVNAIALLFTGTLVVRLMGKRRPAGPGKPDVEPVPTGASRR